MGACSLLTAGFGGLQQAKIRNWTYFEDVGYLWHFGFRAEMGNSRLRLRDSGPKP